LVLSHEKKHNEGEKYGIYPIEWYYDDFRQPITKDRAKELFENTF
jgi:hypothetical protein